MSSQIIVGEPKIIRAVPFDPAEFIDEGYTIWRGSADGNGLEGDEEQDARSLSLAEVDLAKILFETCLKKGKSVIKGEEKLKRLKSAGYIRLDARFGSAFYNEPGHRTLEWLGINRGITWFDFPGTTIRGPYGHRDMLYLSLHGGRWHWRVHWLEHDRYSNEPSAVLASLPAEASAQAGESLGS